MDKIAQADFGLNQFIEQAKKLSGEGQDPFTLVLANIINFLLALAAAAAVIFAIYTGILILGAFGNEEKIASAKRNLAYTLLGLLIIAAAFAIVNLVPTFIKQGRL